MSKECPECGSADIDGEQDEFQPDPWEIHSTGVCTECGTVVHFVHDSPRLDAAIEQMEMNGGYYGRFDY